MTARGLVPAGAALVAALAVSAPAAAAPFWAGCYARTYDAAHLAAHRGQTVTSMALRLARTDAEPPWVASGPMVVTLAGKRTRFYLEAECTGRGAELDCGGEGDAGRFVVSRRGDGLQVTNVADLRFHRADQASDESEGPYVGALNPEDRVFLLRPAPAAACR